MCDWLCSLNEISVFVCCLHTEPKEPTRKDTWCCWLVKRSSSPLHSAYQANCRKCPSPPPTKRTRRAALLPLRLPWATGRLKIGTIGWLAKTWDVGNWTESSRRIGALWAELRDRFVVGALPRGGRGALEKLLQPLLCSSLSVDKVVSKVAYLFFHEPLLPVEAGVPRTLAETLIVHCVPPQARAGSALYRDGLRVVALHQVIKRAIQ